MIDSDFPSEREEWDVALDRRAEVEVPAKDTRLTELVIDEVVAGGEGREIRIA